MTYVGNLMTIHVFWDMTPCRLVYSYEHFAAAWCPPRLRPSPRRHLYANPNSVTSQTVWIFNNTVVRIRNFAGISLTQGSIVYISSRIVRILTIEMRWAEHVAW